MKRWLQFICAILAVVIVCLTGTVSYLLVHSGTAQAAGPYVFYMDYANGTDNTTATPLGWWSVAYTNGNGTTPVANETATGGTSFATAKLTITPIVSGGSWGAGTAAGTLYWYGKSAPFVAETLTFAIGGATCSIAADFTYCAWKTITSGATGARIAPGDTIRELKSEDPTSIGTASWTTGSTTITLGAAQNLNLDMCETAWTAVTGIISTVAAAPSAGGLGYAPNDVLTITTGGTGGTVTVLTVNGGGTVLTVGLTTRGRTYTTGAGKATTGGLGDGNCTINITAIVDATVTRNAIATDGKEGAYSMQVTAPATSVTNACYAYYNIADADYSSYQKVTFWFKNEVACLSTWWIIALCSDDAGATVVDTITVPAIPSAAKWVPLTIARNGAGNLANPVKSIALWTGSVAPTASKYVRLDDFTAATTSGLSLQSLVSKNSHAQCGTDEEGFLPLRSISGTTLVYDSYYGGYAGSTDAAATTYKRETTKTALAAATSTDVQKAQDSGTAASPILFQGGWDSSTGTRNGETYFDGLSVMGSGIANDYQNYNNFEHLSVVRYYSGYLMDQINAAYCTIVECDAMTGCYYGWISSNQNTYNTVTRVYNVLCCNWGLNLQSSYLTITKVDNIVNCSQGLIAQSSNKTGLVITDIDNVLRCSTGLNFQQAASHIYNVDVIEYCAVGITMNTGTATGNLLDNVGKVSHNATQGIFFNNAKGWEIGTIGECHYNVTGIAFTGASHNVIQHIGNLDYNSSYGVDYSLTSQSGGVFENAIMLVDTANNNGVAFNFLWTGSGQYDVANNYVGAVTQCNNSTTYAVRLGGYAAQNVVGSISTSGSGTAPLGLEAMYANNYVMNATFAEATKVSYSGNYAVGQVYVGYSNGNWGVYMCGASSATTQTATIHGASGMAVKTSVGSSDYTSISPFIVAIGRVHCVANVNQTVSVWVKKDHATNIAAKLSCFGGQLAGVGYVSATKASDVNWELLSLPLTPTATGDVVINLESWYVAGVSYVYADLTTSVAADSAYSVEEEGASLSGDVVYTLLPYNMGGGAGMPSIGVSTRGLVYDVDSGAPYAFDWHEHGTNLADDFATVVVGLDEGTRYYFKAYVTDAWATAYSAEGTFLTKPDEPSAFSATSVSSAQIDLAWTKGDGAQNTLIMAKQGSAPTGTGDGIQVYFDVGVACSHSGLTASQHWYYRAWSYVTTGGLTQYSDLSVFDSAISGVTLSIPSVITLAPVVIEEATTVVAGDVTSDGNTDITTRGVEYDTDGAPYAFDWHEHGTFGEGAYAGGVTGLSQGYMYYCRAYATNAEGTTYGTQLTFLTKPDPPTDLVATPTTAILYTLDWLPGAGATSTIIRGKIGFLPTDVLDGILVYDGPGVTCTHDVAGEHWFYRAWSYAAVGVWLQYSDETAMDSCEYCGGGGLPAAPDAPTNFTAVYTSDNLSVFLAWVMGVGSDDTLIQGSLTAYPASPTDGATVYFGPAENCTDSLDWAMIEDGGVVYYSAWGNNAGGLSANYATANTGGGTGMVNALIVIPVILLLGGLSIIGDTKRNWLLILVAGFGWFLFAGWCMTTSAVAWDIYFIIAILGAMIALVTFIWPLVTRPQELPKEEEITESEKAWGGKGKRPQRPKRWQGE